MNPQKTDSHSLLLIGYGKMAHALCSGLKQTYSITITGRDSKKIQEFCQIQKTTPFFLDGHKSIPIQNQQVILCIKPYALEEFDYQGQAHCVYSILNATPLTKLKQTIQAKGYIRAMPNVAAKIAQSMTSLCGDESHKQQALEIFSHLGKTLWIDENNMPIATALAGCSPAFLAIIAEAMIDSGVVHGLTRSQATTLTQGALEGFSALLNKEHPALLKEQIMSPGGSTAKGVASLEKNALRGIIDAAIHASANQA